MEEQNFSSCSSPETAETEELTTWSSRILQVPPEQIKRSHQLNVINQIEGQTMCSRSSPDITAMQERTRWRRSPILQTVDEISRLKISSEASEITEKSFAISAGPCIPEADMKTDSVTVQIGAWEDTDHKAHGITHPSSGNLSSLNNCENKHLSNNCSDVPYDQRLSTPLHPDLSSNSQQSEKQDCFARKKPTRKVRGKLKYNRMHSSKSNFSMKQCIKILRKLPGFKNCDMEYIMEIFSHKLYREAFIAMNRSQKVFWLRSKIDEEKENRSLDRSVASICISGCVDREK